MSTDTSVADGFGEVRCEDCGTRFAPDGAAGAAFNGDVAQYRCPECGGWSRGAPPGC